MTTTAKSPSKPARQTPKSAPKNAPRAKSANSAKPTATTKPPAAPKPPKAATARTSGLDAAFRVLAAAKTPMRVRDITKAAMDRGFWSPGGKTPWATLASAILREVTAKGAKARFKKTGRGLFVAVNKA